MSLYVNKTWKIIFALMAQEQIVNSIYVIVLL